MKKKFILLAGVIVAVVAASLIMVSCSSLPPHKALNSFWDGSETAVYSVTRYSDEVVKEGDARKVITTGEMTMYTKRVDNATITVGSTTIDGFTGSTVSIDMTLADGGVMNSMVAFNTKFVPVASYKKTHIIGYPDERPTQTTTEEVDAKYQGKEYRYNATTTVSGSDPVKVSDKAINLGNWDKNLFFDDIMLYHLVRASFTGKNGAFQALTFAVPSWSDGKKNDVTFNQSAAGVTIKALGDKEYKTAKVAIDRVKKPGTGTPNYVYLSDEAISLGEGLEESAGKRVILMVEEREMVYTLKSITGTKK